MDVNNRGDTSVNNTYDEVISSEYYNKNIQIDCIVTARSLTPYHVPKIIKLVCASVKCNACPIREEQEIIIDATDQSVLQFIDVSTAKMPFVITNVLGLQCKAIKFEVKEVQSVERIYIARPTGKERTRKGGGSRPAYVIGISVETSNVYRFTGYTTIDPSTQSATHVFTHAEKQAKDVESFNLSLNKHSELNEFCISKCDANIMFDKLEDLYTTYSHNITKIYERFDLHLCVDLLYRSVISFRFDNEFVHKGWLEAMIVGDTRCGKGYVGEKLMGYFGLGEVVSGENTSVAGLIGGLQQLNGHWVLNWGRIVLNDHGLLIIDEAGGMQDDMWGKLSRVRSEGIAEITKIQTEIANARTRLLWLCNPTNRTIESYSYGIQCIQELVKAPEDISRFDYILVVAHSEVSGRVINKRREPIPKIHSQSLEQDLILWTWSRKSSEVEFTKEAIKKIYDLSMKMEKMYDFTIPLIQVENVRFKLAKVAIAFAARFYSNREDGKILLVKEGHVDAAYIFFDLIYGKSVSGYKDYSIMKKSVAEVVTKEKLHEIDIYFDSWKLQKKELLRYLLVNNTVDIDSLLIHLGCRKEEAIECFSRLLKAGCIAQRGKFYIKLPEFSKWVKERGLNR